MPRKTVVICMVYIIFCFSGCQNNYTHAVYEVTFTPFIVTNDFVGEEWEIAYTCGGANIDSGERWTIPLNITKVVTIDVPVTRRIEFQMLVSVRYVSIKRTTLKHQPLLQ